MPGLANAQQMVPPAAALQSCSINDGVCELNSYAGWFVGPAQDAKIVQFAAAAIKPSVTTEEHVAADGRTKVVTFKGANGKYLAVQADRNWEVNFVATSPMDDAAQFIPVAGLDNPPGQSFTSFKSLNHQDRFLRHEGFKLFAHVNAGTSLFRRDASWRVLNAAVINTDDVRSGRISVQDAERQATQQQRPAGAANGTCALSSSARSGTIMNGDFVWFNTDSAKKASVGIKNTYREFTDTGWADQSIMITPKGTRASYVLRNGSHGWLAEGKQSPLPADTAGVGCYPVKK